MVRKYKLSKGFTLVELSIVIIIIGFLIAGVSAGQSLIQSAQYNKLISDIHQYDTAFMGFYNRYSAIPGDMKNAESFWGSAAAIDAIPTGTQTWNGNGNGFIDNVSNESLRAWQHLVNAGLINGQFNGVSAGGSSYNDVAIVGVNIPASPLKQTGYNLWSTDGSWFFVPAGLGAHHDIFVGTPVPGLPGSAYARVFTPQEAMLIDAKIDDGKPLTGRVYSNIDFNWDGNCVDGFDYNLSYTAAACLPNFILSAPAN